MKRAFSGIVGFVASSTLSYVLVTAFSGAWSPAEFGTSGSESATAVTETEVARWFRPDLVWHRAAGRGMGPFEGGRTETGIRYVSSTGEQVFAVRIEFSKSGAAAEALRAVRRSGVSEQVFESGIGMTGRFFPPYYVQASADWVPGVETVGCERTQHAIVWVAGDRLEGIYGPTRRSVEDLYLWTQGRPFDE